jgi:choline-sulfatase
MKQPDILFIMSDQHAVRGVGVYGNPQVKTPHIDALSREGVLFRNAVCPSPICVASRAALLAGKHPHRIEAWDNGTVLRCDEPTVMHHLLGAGYTTVASGKCHFIGPDQLHGFQRRLTPDIYPAEMIWVDDWDRPLTRDGGNNRDRVAEAGVMRCNRSLAYDERTAFLALEHLRDLGGSQNRPPFFLFVSFTNPHDPYQTTREYWDRYEEVDIALPDHWNQPAGDLSAMNQWLQTHHDLLQPVEREDALRARRAYYGNCSYIDDKVGEFVRELERQDLSENTVVIFASDHGEMLGEHGMWSKRTFYNGSAGVPLIIRFPGRRWAGRTVESAVSLLDINPTLLDIAGAPPPVDVDGQSLLPLAAGTAGGRTEAFCEYEGDGVLSPCRMIQSGRHKLCYAHGQKGEFYDLFEDPEEMNNLIDSPAHAPVRDRLLKRLLEGWEAAAIDAQVRASQKRRRFIETVRLKSLDQWGYSAAGLKPREINRNRTVGCGTPRENDI